MLETITFALAPIGYLGLTIVALKSAHRAVPVTLLRVVAAVILLHVILVWSVRYQGQFSEATRNGYGGFILFHAALLAIITSAFAGERIARRLIIAAFATVTVGALAAVFRYDVVAMYRIPVIVCAIVGTVGLVRAYRPARRNTAPAAQ